MSTKVETDLFHDAPGIRYGFVRAAGFSRLSVQSAHEDNLRLCVQGTTQINLACGSIIRYEIVENMGLHSATNISPVLGRTVEVTKGIRGTLTSWNSRCDTVQGLIDVDTSSLSQFHGSAEAIQALRVHLTRGLPVLNYQPVTEDHRKPCVPKVGDTLEVVVASVYFLIVLNNPFCFSSLCASIRTQTFTSQKRFAESQKARVTSRRRNPS
jgi:hypothetical protein